MIREPPGKDGSPMARFRLLLVLSLVAGSLSVLATNAAATPNPKVYLGLDTVPHSVGQYSLLLTGFEQVPRFTFLGVELERGTERVSQGHEWGFDLHRGDFTASDDLASAQLSTGELAPAPGERPDYGSIDMGFEGSSPLHSVSVPCPRSGEATFSQRSGTLDGSLDFNTNSALGVVDAQTLQATVTRFAIPAGCGRGVLDTLFQLQFGFSPQECGEGLVVAGAGPLPDGRNTFLFGDKFRFHGRDVALISVDVSDYDNPPAFIDHFVTVFGPPGMIAASRSLDFAHVRARPGKPFLSGFLGFHRTKTLDEHTRKGCDSLLAQGRWKGHMVARFDIGGHAVMRLFGGLIGRTTQTGTESPFSASAPSTARRFMHSALGVLARMAPAWRALAASL